jgi:hypothetical protein
MAIAVPSPAVAAPVDAPQVVAKIEQFFQKYWDAFNIFDEMSRH